MFPLKLFKPQLCSEQLTGWFRVSTKTPGTYTGKGGCTPYFLSPVLFYTLKRQTYLVATISGLSQAT